MHGLFFLFFCWIASGISVFCQAYLNAGPISEQTAVEAAIESKLGSLCPSDGSPCYALSDTVFGLRIEQQPRQLSLKFYLKRGLACAVFIPSEYGCWHGSLLLD